MPNEIYNIIFNSDIGTGATPNELFFFDWSRLPTNLIMFHLLLQVQSQT